MTDSIATGIETLDRKLNGGLPPGATVVLSADPASQSELFLYEFAAVGPTRYLTTMRTEAAVRDTLERRGTDTAAIEVVEVDGDAPLEHAERLLESLPRGSNLVVDPMESLERQEEFRYHRFLSSLRERIDAAGGVAMLHCLDADPRPSRRHATVYMADVVFELSTEVRGDSIESRLKVPKFRGGQSLADVIKLDLTAEVEVDISRNII